MHRSLPCPSTWSLSKSRRDRRRLGRPRARQPVKPSGWDGRNDSARATNRRDRLGGPVWASLCYRRGFRVCTNLHTAAIYASANFLDSMFSAILECLLNDMCGPLLAPIEPLGWHEKAMSRRTYPVLG